MKIKVVNLFVILLLQRFSALASATGFYQVDQCVQGKR